MLRTGPASVSDSGKGSARGGGSAVSMPRTVFSTMRGGTHSSAMPSFFARRASIVLPVSMRSSAAGAPASRGRRFIPPHPGTMPSITSGRPSRVPGSSTTTR